MTRRQIIRIVLLVCAGVTALAAFLDPPFIGPLAKLAFAALVVGALLWFSVRLLRRLLWRVGRRLAFSYFLIGVVPIPMVLGVMLMAAYIGLGFFLGHHYRDTVRIGERELLAAAELDRQAPGAGARPGVALAEYRDGERVGGDRRAPARWPQWLADASATLNAGGDGVVPPVALPDGSPTFAVAAGDATAGAVAFLSADLESELTRRSGVWVELYRADDPERASSYTISIGNQKYGFNPLTGRRTASARAEFFGLQPGQPAPELLDRPLLYWVELSSPFRALEDGRVVAPAVNATLNATTRRLTRELVSKSSELDVAAWAVLIGISALLLEIYAVAVVMAVYMIISLSRAVNRLSRATEGLQAGDFSVRIPVKRKDQLGELQRSFNRLAENLERSVAAAAHREVLEKELEIARELQRSLLPRGVAGELGSYAGRHPLLEFAIHFEPSAAIGGDYFDILRLGPGDGAHPSGAEAGAAAAANRHLAVVIADVAGHGLPAGLRMAMLKAALVILVEDQHEPRRIFERLDALVRGGDQAGAAANRSFVTATLAFLDTQAGQLELTNAGHPPTYLLRGGTVREILLPSSPLGTLGRRFAQERIQLEAGDLVVWLSDGVVEVVDDQGDAFGYQRVAEALAGADGSASGVRDRLLAAVHAWSGGRPAPDDQTLLVMRYGGPTTVRD